MALSVKESYAVNRLLNWICGQSNGLGEVTAEEALDAANTLAAGAFRKLAAGYIGDGDVECVWPKDDE